MLSWRMPPGRYDVEIIRQRLLKMCIKVKADGCYAWFRCIVAKKKKKKKLEVRNLMLLQYPDAADCPLRVKQLKKSEKSGCMEEVVGVLVWEKRKMTM